MTTGNFKRFVGGWGSPGDKGESENGEVLTVAGLQKDLQKAWSEGIAMRFIRGPVSYDWISRCSKLGMKCLNAAIAIWWVHGMEGHPVILTRRRREPFGLSTSSTSRALKMMEKHGLISVEREPGCAPRITMLKVKEVESGKRESQ